MLNIDLEGVLDRSLEIMSADFRTMKSCEKVGDWKNAGMYMERVRKVGDFIYILFGNDVYDYDKETEKYVRKERT